jgi:nicotinamide-nucleotide amidase
MAQGALKHSHADVAVAVSGIAGPDGGSAQRPVGTVVFARAIRDSDSEHVDAEEQRLDGTSRTAVRHQAALVALELLLP